MYCNNTLILHLKKFNKYYIPLIVLAGLTGNLLSISVFKSTKLRHIPATQYLASLAIVDCGVLFIDLFNLCGGTVLMSFNGWCQLLLYANNVFCFLSVWFVVSFTTERFVAVRYPLHRLRWCTIERCRTTILFLVCFACLWNVYLLVTTKPVFLDGSNSTMCTTTEDYMNVVFVFNYLDSALTLLIPFCLIIVLNLSISIKLLYRSPTKSLAQLTISSTRAILHDDFSRRHSNMCQDKKEEKITKVLLIVSMVFLVMNLPDHVLRIATSILYHTDLWSQLEQSNVCRLLVAQIIASVIFQTNFAVNFFLYNLVGKNFRRHVRNLFSSSLNRLKSGLCLKNIIKKKKHSLRISRQNSTVTTTVF